MLEITVNHTLVFVPERKVRFRTNFYFEYQFYVHVIFFLPSTHFYDTCSFMQNCYLKIWLINYLIFIFMINAYLTIFHIPYQNPYIDNCLRRFCFLPNSLRLSWTIEYCLLLYQGQYILDTRSTASLLFTCQSLNSDVLVNMKFWKKKRKEKKKKEKRKLGNIASSRKKTLTGAISSLVINSLYLKIH